MEREREMRKVLEIENEIMEVVEASRQGVPNSDVQGLAQAKALKIIRKE
jgi:hypothetical protein